MLTNQKRIVYLFVTAVLLNLLCFIVAYFFKLPMWLDTTGTIYISMILGFPYGFVTGYINSVISSLFFYGYHSLGYYVVSMAVAIAVEKITKNGRFKVLRGLELTAAVFVSSAIVAIILTFVVDAGVPADYWSKRLYTQLRNSGFSSFLATILSVSGIKLIDSILSVLIAWIAFALSPVRIRTDEYIIRNHMD